MATGRDNAAPPLPDRLAVVAHFPLAGGPVTQLTTGTHWQKDCLYADHGAAGPVTIVDVTNPAAPAAAGELDVPAAEAGGSLSAVVRTTALVTSSPPGTTPEKQTVTVLSFADPEHPSVVRQFAGVTAMLNDDARGLIYLADSGGLWALRAEPATDVELEREYAEYVLYDH